MTHELTLLNQKPAAGPLSRYLVPDTILTIENIAMLDLKKLREPHEQKIQQRSVCDIGGNLPQHMQPCGDKKQNI